MTVCVCVSSLYFLHVLYQNLKKQKNKINKPTFHSLKNAFCSPKKKKKKSLRDTGLFAAVFPGWRITATELNSFLLHHMTGLQQDSPLIEKERALGLTGARVSGLNWYGLGPPWSSTTLMSASRDPGGEKSSTSKEPPGSELPGAAVSLSILLWPEDQWVTPHVLSASSGSFSTLAHFKYFSTFTCRKPQTELG